MQRALLRLPRHLSRRAFTTSTPRQTTPFETGPAPPRLPKEEQEIFERLQRQSTGAFSTPRSAPSSDINQSPDPSPPPPPTRTQINQSPDSASSPPSSTQQSQVQVNIEGGGKISEGDEVHPHMRRGAPPEFEGDVNPKTGEVGGPKNEPLRWGSAGDWSFNGRVTDF